jgi:hypothetical protein
MQAFPRSFHDWVDERSLPSELRGLIAGPEPIAVKYEQALIRGCHFRSERLDGRCKRSQDSGVKASLLAKRPGSAQAERLTYFGRLQSLYEVEVGGKKRVYARVKWFRKPIEDEDGNLVIRKGHTINDKWQPWITLEQLRGQVFFGPDHLEPGALVVLEKEPWHYERGVENAGDEENLRAARGGKRKKMGGKTPFKSPTERTGADSSQENGPQVDWGNESKEERDEASINPSDSRDGGEENTGDSQSESGPGSKDSQSESGPGSKDSQSESGPGSRDSQSESGRGNGDSQSESGPGSRDRRLESGPEKGNRDSQSESGPGKGKRDSQSESGPGNRDCQLGDRGSRLEEGEWGDRGSRSGGRARRERDSWSDEEGGTDQNRRSKGGSTEVHNSLSEESGGGDQESESLGVGEEDQNGQAGERGAEDRGSESGEAEGEEVPGVLALWENPLLQSDLKDSLSSPSPPNGLPFPAEIERCVLHAVNRRLAADEILATIRELSGGLLDVKRSDFRTLCKGKELNDTVSHTYIRLIQILRNEGM